ncbi:hypothetical protein GF402_11095 [Candidatus Fermentibacteria bacterium]|nr:hypothetical protein [Candidatus Fermentibacteria bacterium]
MQCGHKHFVRLSQGFRLFLGGGVVPGHGASPGEGGCRLRRHQRKHAARVFCRDRKAIPASNDQHSAANLAESGPDGCKEGRSDGYEVHHGGFYEEAASDLGITVIVPNEKDRDYVDNALMTELRHGEVVDGTRTGLLEIVSRMIEKSDIDGLILGCTELPMILRGPYKGVPFLDTTDIHCRAIAAYATKEHS